jgi:hypothetical protein
MTRYPLILSFVFLFFFGRSQGGREEGRDGGREGRRGGMRGVCVSDWLVVSNLLMIIIY